MFPQKKLAIEPNPIKSWTILQNFGSRIIKFTVKPFGNLAKLGILVNFHPKIEVFLNYLAFYCVSFSIESLFHGNKRKYFTHNPGLTLLTRNQSYFLKNSDQKSSMNIFYLIIDMFFFSKWIVIAWVSAKGLNRLFAMVDSIRVKKYV